MTHQDESLSPVPTGELEERMRGVYYETGSRHPGLCYYRGTPLMLWREALSRAGCELSAVAAPTSDLAQAEFTAEGLRDQGEQLAERLLATYRADAGRRPEIWVTGGICPHAPDWVGVRVVRELGIPYVLVEPQIGPGTSELATAEEKQSAKNAVQAAARIVTTRSETARSLATLLDDSSRLTQVLPFLDLAPSLSASHLRDTHRNELVRQRGLPCMSPCLVTDGPQEPGDTLGAWQMFAVALSRIVTLDWHVLVIGDGNAEQDVRQAMRRLPHQRVHYWNAPTPDDRLRALAGSDLYVWPATDGSSLASLLEAQATGTPVVACSRPDVLDRVLDGQTGRLAAPNAESLANGISFLLRHRDFLETYGRQARETTASQHDLRVAAEALRGSLGF